MPAKLRFIRKIASASLFVLAAAAQAGTGVAGTRLGGDYTQTPSTSTGVGFGALAQMVLALAIVAFLLKWVLPKVAGKLTKKLVTTAQGGIQIEESAQFAGGSLYIVSARGKSILISVAGTTVSTLTELTQAPQSQPDAFELALAQAQARPGQTNAELEARAALDRLSHLTVGHAR
jgi:hypothetical protein